MIRIDTREVIRNLNRFSEDVLTMGAREFQDQIREMETGAKALAPKDEGNLEDGISSEVNILSNKFEGKIKAGGTGTKYSQRMHEDVYTPGPITRGKPSYKGYSPGRKYIENAIKANLQSFMQSMRQIFRGR